MPEDGPSPGVYEPLSARLPLLCAQAAPWAFEVEPERSLLGPALAPPHTHRTPSITVFRTREVFFLDPVVSFSSLTFTGLYWTYRYADI